MVRPKSAKRLERERYAEEMFQRVFGPVTVRDPDSDFGSWKAYTFVYPEKSNDKSGDGA